MTLYEFEGRRPQIGKTSFIAESADIVGDVRMGERCFIGPGAKIKGDYGTIIIGDDTSIQENCVMHARPGETTTVGKNVTVGHGAIIHGPTINDFAVIGMGAIVSDFAVVGEWGVVAEGCVVRSKQDIPPESIAVGIPAKVIGKIDQAYKDQWMKFKKIYSDLAEKRYPEGLKKIE